MPTYVCSSRSGSLDAARKAAVARVITRGHGEATGAPTYLVQVVHEERPAGDRYIGGRAADRHIWIRGDIRAGRGVAQRQRLISVIARDVARIAGLAATDVWVYLCELAPTDMVEFGHVLPEAGGEAAWFDALPKALQDELLALGAEVSDGGGR